MSFGEKFQIASVCMAVGAGILGILAAIFGFLGNIFADRSYADAFKSLTKKIEVAQILQLPAWTPFLKVDASASWPPNARIANIQYRLWSDNITILLRIRIAPDKDHKFVQEGEGSGVIHMMITEGQTFYVSFSHPKIQYEVGVVGYEF